MGDIFLLTKLMFVHIIYIYPYGYNKVKEGAQNENRKEYINCLYFKLLICSF